ncbi:hypothetical protein C2845_PM13G01840 [Panicum miliaceum]|uniref:Uncharacterized protein n=1 Tax=Panicum miliaceum TaxID=4540 RepID=A0A3L6RF28_PANMI|nr:hypothetical protein C2845_PM13G01840 [Panicum miliaceum]
MQRTRRGRKDAPARRLAALGGGQLSSTRGRGSGGSGEASSCLAGQGQAAHGPRSRPQQPPRRGATRPAAAGLVLAQLQGVRSPRQPRRGCVPEQARSRHTVQQPAGFG